VCVCVCVFFRILCSNCAHVISSCGLLAVSRMCVAGAKKTGASSTLSWEKTPSYGFLQPLHTRTRFFTNISPSRSKKWLQERETYGGCLLQEHSVLETCRHEVMCTRPLHTFIRFLFYILVLFVVGLHMINRRMVIH